MLWSPYGYALLAEKIYNNQSFGDAFNFGPLYQDSINVISLVELFRTYLNGELSIQLLQSSKNSIHETRELYLDVSKSNSILGYTPRWNIEKSVERTVRWFEGYKNGECALKLCQDDIENFF